MVKFLPWSVETVQGGPKIYAGGGSDHAICQLFSRDGLAFLDANENAALIVKAVNNHDAMDKLLAEAADYLNTHNGMDGMDLGNKITQFRLALQKQSGAAVGGSKL